MSVLSPLSLRGEAEAIHNQAQSKTLQWNLYKQDSTIWNATRF
ncbi:hypothetical protein [Helicobacter rodentium]|nr:hypothetical protein [Helicobacter rodentium]